jgi:hypothetical protein
MTLDLVRVDWYDAEGQERWENHGDTLEWAEGLPIIVTSFGLLTFECETHLTLAQSHTEHQLMHVLKIPKGCIHRIEHLTPTTLTI